MTGNPLGQPPLSQRVLLLGAIMQYSLFDDTETFDGPRRYRAALTVIENTKGVLDVDTVKGCSLGIAAYPQGGCYGECYANKIAARYGIDFGTSIIRRILKSQYADCFFAIKNHYNKWYRIGTAGDPSHDWEHTISVCEALKDTDKIPVIITKHWRVITDSQLYRLKILSAVINTSVSGMDTDDELNHRVEQIGRIKYAGVKSVCRVVTCKYGSSDWAKRCNEKQDYLLSFDNVINNPLRASKNNSRVISGDIILVKKAESIGGGKLVSLHNENIYLGTCDKCLDQCGADIAHAKTQKQEA